MIEQLNLPRNAVLCDLLCVLEYERLLMLHRQLQIRAYKVRGKLINMVLNEAERRQNYDMLVWSNNVGNFYCNQYKLTHLR